MKLKVEKSIWQQYKVDSKQHMARDNKVEIIIFISVSL